MNVNQKTEEKSAVNPENIIPMVGVFSEKLLETQDSLGDLLEALIKLKGSLSEIGYEKESEKERVFKDFFTAVDAATKHHHSFKDLGDTFFDCVIDDENESGEESGAK